MLLILSEGVGMRIVVVLLAKVLDSGEDHDNYIIRLIGNELQKLGYKIGPIGIFNELPFGSLH